MHRIGTILNRRAQRNAHDANRVLVRRRDQRDDAELATRAAQAQADLQGPART